MKFTEFKNGNDFLEYIQIYVYYHLHEKKDDVNICLLYTYDAD